MRLRKINAGLSLLTTILFLGHAMFLSVWMLSRCMIAKTVGILPWVLAGVFVIHALLSIFLGILGHKGAEKRKCNTYPKMNIQTCVQRMTGILMILLLGLHIAGAANHFQPKMLHAILHPMFFAAALGHVSVSASKALITLGIGNAKTVRVVDIAVKVLCVSTFIAAVIGFYLCLFVGVAR